MTSVSYSDGRAENYTYDAAGNPPSYYNGQNYTMTWTEGRKLASVTTADGTTSYLYNADGLRFKKVNPDGSYIIYLATDGVIIGEKHYTSEHVLTKNLRYTFDENGQVCGYSTSTDGTTWTDYYFIRNLQGDFLQVFRESDTVIVAEYSYDSWGNILSATGEKAEENPFRYRGYYCDAETGLYYVSSRYYDPEIGRWINADSQLNTSLGVLGLNQFSYCLNNPVNMVDYGGNKPGDLFDTMDEAAKDFAEYINETSIEVDREYASYIYTKTVWETKTVTYYNPNLFGNNLLSRFWNYIFGGGISKTVKKRVQVTKYTYVKPAKGTAHSSTIPINWFGMHNQVALLHTHGAYSPGYGNDVFSSTDKNLAKMLVALLMQKMQ